MDLIILFFSIIITIFLPLPSIILNILCFIVSKKYKKYHGVILAFSLACTAYIWNPSAKMDLYRWHLAMDSMKNYSFKNIIELFKINFEFFNYYIIFIINKLNNNNLLQAFVSFIGYSEILWMLADYQKEKKINDFSFTLTTVLILISLDYIGFISGLWFNLAIINFALGVYLRFFKEKKYIPWFLFIFSILTHISTIFILFMFMLCNLTKKRVTIKILITVFLAFILIDPIITALNSTFNNEIIHIVYRMYFSYFINGNQFASLHNGSNIISAIARILLCIIIAYKSTKNEGISPKYIKFILLTSTAVYAILFNATVFVRFAFFIQLASIPMIMSYFTTIDSKKQINKAKMSTILLAFLIISIMIYRQNNSINNSNLKEDFNSNIVNSVLKLKNRGAI